MGGLLVVPVDLSSASPRVVEYARRLAERRSARLCLLHVVRYRKLNMGYAIAFPDAAQAEGRLAAAARRRLAALAAGRAHVFVQRGDAARGIVAAAERLGADAIVMDGSAHSALRHLARGRARCLLEQVARLSRVPLHAVAFSADGAACRPHGRRIRPGRRGGPFSARTRARDRRRSAP